MVPAELSDDLGNYSQKDQQNDHCGVAFSHQEADDQDKPVQDRRCAEALQLCRRKQVDESKEQRRYRACIGITGRVDESAGGCQDKQCQIDDRSEQKWKYGQLFIK